MSKKEQHLLAFGEVMKVLGENAEMLSKNPKYAKQITDFVEKFAEAVEEETCGGCNAYVPRHDEENECRRCSGIFCNDCLVPEKGDFYCRNCYQAWF